MTDKLKRSELPEHRTTSGRDASRQIAGFLEAEAQVFAACSLAPRIRRVRSADLTLRVIELGSGEPVLVLHGLGGCAVQWAPLLSRLPSVRSFAIDLPGHGASDDFDCRGVDLRRWSSDVLTGCLDALDLASVHVIGHSMGAMFGLWLALDAPQRVRTLVAIGTPAVAFGADRMPAFIKMAGTPGIGPLVLSMPTPLFLYRRMAATMLGRHAVEAAPRSFMRAMYLGARGGSHARTISALAHEQTRVITAERRRYALSDDELARIKRPVLIMWGQLEDGLVLSVAEGARKTALIPNARFEVLPGGHLPWLDSPERCAELIGEHLRTTPGGA